jgi:hypothetical protein
MRSTFLLCAIFLSLALASAQTSKPISLFDQQLIDQQKQFLQANEDKNAAVLRHSVADDFRGIGTNGDFYGKSEVVEGGLPKDTRAYDFNVVKLNDDSAIVAYNLVVPEGHPRYRHMADTWVKSDGQWQLKFSQVTPNLWSANDFD